jgi:hypothetical protein
MKNPPYNTFLCLQTLVPGPACSLPRRVRSRRTQWQAGQGPGTARPLAGHWQGTYMLLLSPRVSLATHAYCYSVLTCHCLEARVVEHNAFDQRSLWSTRTRLCLCQVAAARTVSFYGIEFEF